MSDKDLHKQYAKCWKNRSEGHALYRNVSATQLKPGTCGYFDKDGDWQVIVQATDLSSEELEALGLSGLRGVGGKLEFSTSKKRSAILIAKGNVEHNQATPATRLREWGSKHAQTLIDLSGDRDIIKKKGFWIVTKTFTAKQCALSLLLSKESKSSYSIDARAYGTKCSPSLAWWNSQKDENWRELSHPDGVVMFMSGIWWRPRLLSKEMKAEYDKERQKSLPASVGPVPVDVTILSAESEDIEFYHFTAAAVGFDKKNPLNLPQAKTSPYDDNDAAVSDNDE